MPELGGSLNSSLGHDKLPAFRFSRSASSPVHLAICVGKQAAAAFSIQLPTETRNQSGIFLKKMPPATNL
jgi:hypothetical protein